MINLYHNKNISVRILGNRCKLKKNYIKYYYFLICSIEIILHQPKTVKNTNIKKNKKINEKCFSFRNKSCGSKIY